MSHFLAVRILISLTLAAVCFASCNSPDSNQSSLAEAHRTPIVLDYAKRFQAWTYGRTVEIKVNAGNQSPDTITYTLIPRDTEGRKHLAAGHNIEVPIQKLVVTSTSHIPFLSLLGIPEALVGFPNTQYISSAGIRKRIDQGLVQNVGDASGLNFESLIALQPELVITYLSGADHSELQQLDQSGIPHVLNFDFMEETPLGRAEWIKFIGLLLGKTKQAESVFAVIENEYRTLQRHTRNLAIRPTVFSGILYGDTWFAPGANSFAAKLIEDAGGAYSWSDLKSSGSVELSLEAVMDRNASTDFWIGPGDYTTKADLLRADTRYVHFQAFRMDQIYNSHGRIGSTGGFEYFELAGARPDLVLGDLISIFHPESLPNHELYFYQKLD